MSRSFAAHGQRMYRPLKRLLTTRATHAQHMRVVRRRYLRVTVQTYAAVAHAHGGQAQHVVVRGQYCCGPAHMFGRHAAVSIDVMLFGLMGFRFSSLGCNLASVLPAS